MLLEVRDLEVAYGDYQVIWGVSLSVAAGESVALLTDAFPSRESDGVQMTKIQQFVKEGFP